MGNVSAADTSKSHVDLPSPPLMMPPHATERPARAHARETSQTGPAEVVSPGLYEDLHKQTKGAAPALPPGKKLKKHQQSQDQPWTLCCQTLGLPHTSEENVRDQRVLQVLPDRHPATVAKSQNLFPQVFEGAKVIIAKGLSSHFQISHTITLSTFTPSLYRFGATYIGTKQLSSTEAFPVLLGDIDSSGNMNANIIHALSDRLRAKLVAQFQPNKCVGHQLSMDYKGDDYTASVTMGNLDPIYMSGLLVGHYLQRITPSLALGAEIMYQRGQQIPGGEIAIMSLAGRWTGNKWQLSANLSPMAGNLHTCFYQRVHEYLQVGVELETSIRMAESTATVAYQIDIPKADVTFRGQLDSNWCIGAVLEKKLAPFPFTLALSGYANHVKSQYRFGIGMIIG